MSERRELSLRLNDVLEMVGVTEEMRRLHRRTATMREMLIIVDRKRDFGVLFNVYVCGSSWESTLTPDLASDIDEIICPTELLVVPHRRMAGPGKFLYAVRDDSTRPGYVKLQLMRNGRLLTVIDVEENDYVGIDREGRACFKHVAAGNMHGPATTLVDVQGRHLEDIVWAYQCKGILLFATDWITRTRQYGWPSQQLINELKMMGCLFVGVGHFDSRDKELEWRLSFSLQERMLMKNLNITQHRVYVILKMIRKDILDKCLNEESLSSYHCKTCVFYMAETTPASMWIPENIINCLLQCLALLLRWIEDRFCPSFFLKDSNLFDKEGFLRLAGPLEGLIASLLQKGHQFLYSLQSDRVGELLKCGNLMLYKPVADSSIDKYIFVKDKSSLICLSIRIFCPLMRLYKSDSDLLSSYMTELENCEHDESCTEGEYRAALRLALPWLHLYIGLEVAARAVTCQDRHEGKELKKKVDYHLQQARNTDLVSVRLVQATLSMRLEKLEDCLVLLQELEHCWAYRVVTYCPCAHLSMIKNEQQLCELAAECRNMPLRELMRTRWASCVIFERSQTQLVPSPLRYELYRSLFTLPGSIDEVHDVSVDIAVKNAFDRAVVDAQVYLYLLLYMVCSKLNLEPHKRIAIDNLTSITLREMPILSHRETAFNLLGWIYLQEHRAADALRCFLRSWQIRPHHNAAKFHVLIESYRLAKTSEGRQNNTQSWNL